MDILFVCTGNTCRSAMAKVIANKILPEKGIEARISSAGTYAFQGSIASENSINVMEEIGIDLHDHIATSLDEEVIMKNDIILTMTNEQKDSILSDYPNYKNKVYTLGEYTKSNVEILDPFGGDIEVYRDCREQLIKHICNLASVISNIE